MTPDADISEMNQPVTGDVVAGEPIRAGLTRNALWMASGSALSQALSLVTTILIARVLGVSHFGQLAIVQSTVLMVGTLGEMGATLTTTKFVSSWRVVDPVRTGRLIGFSLAMTAAMGCALTMALGWIHTYNRISSFTGISTETHAAYALLLFDMLNRIQFGALAGLEAFAESAKIQTIRGILTLPCVWLGAQRGGLAGAIAAMSVVSLVTFAIGHGTLRKTCRLLSIPLQYKSGVQIEVLTTSLSLWASTLLLTGSTWLVNVLLTRAPDGLFQLGLYNAADKWKTALLFVPQILFQVILPMLSRSRAERNNVACRRILRAALGATLGFTGAAAGVVFLLAGPLMSSYGRAFAQGADILSLAAVAALASALYTVGSAALWAIGRPSAMLRIDISKTLLLVALCELGYANSAWKLMFANLITFSIGAVIVVLVVHKELECPKV
jgi:O-antigen/teichoic acid export membrane protein